MRAGAGHGYAQVWVPAGRLFAALEPMTDRTKSLVDSTVRLVPPGDAQPPRSRSPWGTRVITKEHTIDPQPFGGRPAVLEPSTC
jgi:hypothetical protein